MTSNVDPWFPLRDGRDSAALRLFVFPYAGGGASAFREWSSGLPESVSVLPLQPPGREQRLGEAAYSTMEDLVGEALKAMEPLLDRPFAFYGHSLGALVAYEAIRTLRGRGAALPAHLFASGSRAPHTSLKCAQIHDLEGEAFLERLRELGGTPPAVLDSAELMDLFSPMLRADLRISETYLNDDPDPLAVPLTTLGGTEDEEVGRERLEAWSAQTSAAFDLHWLPGDHFFLHSSESDVLSIVAAALEPHAG